MTRRDEAGAQNPRLDSHQMDTRQDDHLDHGSPIETHRGNAEEQTDQRIDALVLACLDAEPLPIKSLLPLVLAVDRLLKAERLERSIHARWAA